MEKSNRVKSNRVSDPLFFLNEIHIYIIHVPTTFVVRSTLRAGSARFRRQIFVAFKNTIRWGECTTLVFRPLYLYVCIIFFYFLPPPSFNHKERFRSLHNKSILRSGDNGFTRHKATRQLLNLVKISS